MSQFQRYATTVSQFINYPATKKLQELAKKPFDLTGSGNLTPDRISGMQCSAAGWKLIYGCERIDEQVLTQLEELATQADVVSRMQKMQDGEVTNYLEGIESENRAVLHTAMRDLFEMPKTGKLAVEATGKARTEHEKLKTFMDEIEGEFTHLVMVGIGGSDLGPKSLYLSLEALKRKDRQVHFISNVDPDDSAQVMAGLPLKETMVCVVSKSGSTIETLTNETIVRNRFESAGLDPARHVVAVTAQGSPMDDTSKYRQAFYMWDYVGGRFCSTSLVGGVLLSFSIGYDAYLEVLQGCHAMDTNACNTNVRENLPLMMALLGIWNHNFLGYPTCAIVPYAQALIRFPAHLQQCDMESNGKRIDQKGQTLDFSSGPIVWGEPGTNAQHSFYQLIHQSTDVVPVELIGFKENQRGEDELVQGTTSQEKLLSNLFAQALALAVGQQDENPNRVFPGNRPTRMLLANKATPYTIGALLALYEHKIAFQGFIWHINSFDQEGVQLGKVLANKILTEFHAKRDSSKEAQSCPVGSAFIAELDRL